MKPKKIPTRLCVGCGEMKPKRELVRVVKSEQQISLDLTGKKSGRGAYICKNAACLQQARKTRRLEKAFSCKIENAIYEEMLHEIANTESESSDGLSEGGTSGSGV